MSPLGLKYFDIIIYSFLLEFLLSSILRVFSVSLLWLHFSRSLYVDQQFKQLARCFPRAGVGRGGILVLSKIFPTPLWYTIQLFESLAFIDIQSEQGAL